MGVLEKSSRTLGDSVKIKDGEGNPSSWIEEDRNASGYEKCRDARIKENLRRMQNLGIFDLSNKFKSESRSPKRPCRRNLERKSPLHDSLPTRRSSRLQSVTPVNYVEEPHKQTRSEGENNLVTEGRKREVYSDEHYKLLGTSEKAWELFKDGYGIDGKRIYDPVRGKTCHQCRQKTLGHRTHCSKCNLVQGQFCGDCLYLRYGENVLEANENPNWICPVCRDICNCSLCRIKKGWAPTGALARKVSELGFKSVAHYLIQTLRAQPDCEVPVPSHPTLAKRSLPFTDEGVALNEVELKNRAMEMESKGSEEKSVGKMELVASNFTTGEVLNPDGGDSTEQEKSPGSKTESDASKTETDDAPGLRMCEKIENEQKTSSVDVRAPESEQKPEMKPLSKQAFCSPDSIKWRLRKNPGADSALFENEPNLEENLVLALPCNPNSN